MIGEDKFDDRETAIQMIEALKIEEKKTKFYKERINKNTIVFCKKRENLRLYKQLFNKA